MSMWPDMKATRGGFGGESVGIVGCVVPASRGLGEVGDVRGDAMSVGVGDCGCCCCSCSCCGMVFKLC